MHEFERICVSTENKIYINDYRYNSQIFYFKLCNEESVELNSSEMIRGLYLPLEYWDRLLVSDLSTGPRGGKYVGYTNCGRHFNNSLFIDMVKSGWIGSRCVTSEQITKIINMVLTTGKSLVFAKFENNKYKTPPLRIMPVYRQTTAKSQNTRRRRNTGTSAILWSVVYNKFTRGKYNAAGNENKSARGIWNKTKANRLLNS